MNLGLLSLFALGDLVVFFGGFYLGSSLNTSSPDLNQVKNPQGLIHARMRKDNSPKKKNAGSVQLTEGGSMTREALATPSESARMRFLFTQIREREKSHHPFLRTDASYEGLKF